MKKKLCWLTRQSVPKKQTYLSNLFPVIRRVMNRQEHQGAGAVN